MSLFSDIFGSGPTIGKTSTPKPASSAGADPSSDATPTSGAATTKSPNATSKTSFDGAGTGKSASTGSKATSGAGDSSDLIGSLISQYRSHAALDTASGATNNQNPTAVPGSQTQNQLTMPPPAGMSNSGADLQGGTPSASESQSPVTADTPSDAPSDATAGAGLANQTTANSDSGPNDATAGAGLTAHVEVYDGSQPQANGSAKDLGGLAQVDANGPANAKAAAQNVQTGLNFFYNNFGRNGIDGDGGTVDVVVNDQSKAADGSYLFAGNGGYYISTDPDGTEHEALRFGTGADYTTADGGTVDQAQMEYSTNLVVHEMTHGIVHQMTGLDGGTPDEAGAVNEGLADTMGAAATHDWDMGDQLYGADSSYDTMRDIADPNDPKSLYPLWGTVQKVDQEAAAGNMEEHYASGVISEAFYRIQQHLGWTDMQNLCYDTITSGDLHTLSFAETAQAIRDTAARLWGDQSSQYSVVTNSLQQSGL